MTIRIAMLDDSKPFRIKFPHTKRRESVWHFKESRIQYGASFGMYHELYGLRSRFPHKWTYCEIYGANQNDLYRLKYVKKLAIKTRRDSYNMMNNSTYVPF